MSSINENALVVSVCANHFAEVPEKVFVKMSNSKSGKAYGVELPICEAVYN